MWCVGGVGRKRAIVHPIKVGEYLCLTREKAEEEREGERMCTSERERKDASESERESTGARESKRERVCVCVCVSECVCVREREQERGRERKTERERKRDREGEKGGERKKAKPTATTNPKIGSFVSEIVQKNNLFRQRKRTALYRAEKGSPERKKTSLAATRG